MPGRGRRSTRMANAADETKVKESGERDKRGRELELADVAGILMTESGRRFYWNLLKKCGVFESSFTGNNTTFFNEGQRNIGLQLLNDLNEAYPDAYIKMLQESHKRKI